MFCRGDIPNTACVRCYMLLWPCLKLVQNDTDVCTMDEFRKYFIASISANCARMLSLLWKNILCSGICNSIQRYSTRPLLQLKRNSTVSRREPFHIPQDSIIYKSGQIIHSSAQRVWTIYKDLRFPLCSSTVQACALIQIPTLCSPRSVREIPAGAQTKLTA